MAITISGRPLFTRFRRGGAGGGDGFLDLDGGGPVQAFDMQRRRAIIGNAATDPDLLGKYAHHVAWRARSDDKGRLVGNAVPDRVKDIGAADFPFVGRVDERVLLEGDARPIARNDVQVRLRQRGAETHIAVGADGQAAGRAGAVDPERHSVGGQVLDPEEVEAVVVAPDRPVGRRTAWAGAVLQQNIDIDLELIRSETPKDTVPESPPTQRRPLME
ncbi:MAG: hypothetical protein R3D85_15040 [Paracoccaceae bacterium]